MVSGLINSLRLFSLLSLLIGEKRAAALEAKVRQILHSPSFWALGDQGVLSIGNFASNIALMHKLDKTEFGTYLLLQSIVALLNNLHASVITYPLSIKGAAAESEGLRGLATSALGLTAGLGLPMVVVVFIAASMLHSVAIAPFVAISVIAWQLQETARRALMAHLRNNEALWGDIVSYLGQAGVIILLCWGRTPQLWEIFTANALTSLAAAAIQGVQLRLSKFNAGSAVLLAAEGWQIGRWLLVTNGLYLLTIQAITWTINGYHGREAVATFGALSNVIGVSHPVMFGICGLIVPAVARTRIQHGDKAALRYSSKLGLIGLALLLPYYIFLVLFPGTALWLFCGSNSPYLGLTTELRWYVAQYVFVYLAFISAAVLNGFEAARWTFLGQLANALVTAVVRIPATAEIGIGVSAAIWSGVFTYAAQTVVNLKGIFSVTRQKKGDAIVSKTPPSANGHSVAIAAPLTDRPPNGRNRILVSAYTLSPKRGSEPAGAWNVVTRLAKFHDLTVITSSECEGVDYRNETLNYLRTHPIEGLTLHYVAPPPLAKKLMKPSGTLARLFYYVGYAAWQREAFKSAKALCEQQSFDLVHQLNMTGYREPGYLWKLPLPFIWGPIAGACNMPWSFLKTMDAKERLFYGIRNIANSIQRFTCVRCRLAAKASRLIWYVGPDEKSLIERTWDNKMTEPMLDSGTSPAPRSPTGYNRQRPLRLVWSGVHIGRKGFPLLLHALAKLKDLPIEVIVLGSGPQTERWDTLASRLGVLGRLRWKGRLPREEALAEMAKSDVLVFTSLMEAASHVTLEAISLGLPVICHDACGMSIAVDDRTGIKIPLTNLQTSIDGFAAAIRKLAENPEELRRLSEGSAQRATELTWDATVEQMCAGYRRVLASPQIPETPAPTLDEVMADEFQTTSNVQP